jgi:hypothetical protein
MAVDLTLITDGEIELYAKGTIQKRSIFNKEGAQNANPNT